MSGVWSQILSLDLTIPSNGALTPGSGTVYIGGPQLPPELVAASYTAAFIWYSTANDVAYADYYFIGHTNDLNGQGIGGWVRGLVLGGGILVIETISGDGQSPYANDYTLSTDIYTQYSGFQTNYYMQQNGQWLFQNLQNNNPVQLIHPATKPGYLTTTDPTIDTVLTGSGFAMSPAATSSNYTMRVSFDRIVEFRAEIVYATPPANLSITSVSQVVPTFALPTTMTLPILGQSVLANCFGRTTTSGGVVGVPITAFIGGNGAVLIRGGTNPSLLYFSIYATWTLAKP